jgi:hypothetical protein
MGSFTNLLPVLKGNREEFRKWMPVIADISAAFGLTLQEATTNTIRAISAGIASSDLFREKGITAVLGFQLGKSYTGKESAEGILKEWGKNFSIIKDASKELAHTWDGIVGMMQDRWVLFVKKIGDYGIFATLKARLQAVLETWDKMAEKNEFGVSQLDILAQNISRALELLFKKIQNFFYKLFKLVSKFAFIGTWFDTREESDLKNKISAVEEEISEMYEQKHYGAPLDEEALESLTDRLSFLKKELESVKKSGGDFGKALEEVMANIKKLTGGDTDAVLNAGGRIKIVKPVDEEKIAEAKLLAKAAAKETKYFDLLQDASIKISDKQTANQISSIRALRGEWAAQQAQVNFDAEKLKKDLIDKIKKGTEFGEERYMPDIDRIVKEFKSVSLAGMLDPQIKEAKTKIKSAERELMSLDMTDYQKERNQTLWEYKDASFGAADAVKELLAKERDIKLATIASTKAKSDKILTLQRENELQQLQYKDTQKYTAQMAALKNTLEQEGGSGNADALTRFQHSVQILSTTTKKELESSLREANAQLRSLGQTDAQRDMADLNRQFMALDDAKGQFPELTAQVKKLKQALQDINNQKHPKTFAEGWNNATTEMKSKILTVGQIGTTMAQKTSDAMAGAFEEGFFAVFEKGIDGLGDAFAGFAESVLKALVQIQAQQMAIGIMGSSKAGTGIAGWFSGLFHDGGVVGATQPTQHKLVNPSIFNSAPKFHEGLMPDEFPAILQKGELVIPKDGWTSGNTGTSNVNVRIHNEGGEQMQVKRTEAQQDMSGMVLDIWIDGYTRNKNGLRTMLGG